MSVSYFLFYYTTTHYSNLQQGSQPSEITEYYFEGNNYARDAIQTRIIKVEEYILIPTDEPYNHNGFCPYDLTPSFGICSPPPTFSPTSAPSTTPTTTPSTTPTTTPSTTPTMLTYQVAVSILISTVVGLAQYCRAVVVIVTSSSKQ